MSPDGVTERLNNEFRRMGDERMQPGIWTTFLYGMSLEEFIPAFAAKGWMRLELSDEHSMQLRERGDPKRTGRDFRRFAEDHGVSFPQGHLWLVCDIVGSNQDEVLPELKRWLDLYQALGITAAVLHPGGDALRDQGASAERVLDCQARALRELCGHVAGTDLHICLENMHRQTADDLCRIIEAAGCGNLAICLDTGHLNLLPGDQAQFIRKAGSLLRALHIADNDGSWDQHLMPFGRGTVAWDRVIPALKEVSYDGLFNFEIPGEIRCPIAVRLAKLDYLKAILPTLLNGTE